MPYDKTQQSAYDTVTHYMSQPVIKGSFLGAGVMFLITPGVNKFNYMATGHHMPWSQALTGWQPLVVSGVVGCATSFTVKNMLGDNQSDAAAFHQFWTSAAAGAVSGIMLCPFESVNQNHKEGPLNDTRRAMMKHHGYRGFFHGTASMIARESSWTLMYMTAVPSISQKFRDAGYNRAAADACSLIFCAGLFGFMSTPINRLRAMKQQSLTMPRAVPSYRELASTLFHEHKDKTGPERLSRCFKGAGVRSITSAVAGGLFYYGSEAYDEYVAPKKAPGL